MIASHTGRPLKALAICAVMLATLGAALAEEPVFKVGVTARDFVPPEPYDWRGAKTHVLRTTIWYPAITDAREEPQWVGPPVVPFFSAGSAARDAKPAGGLRRPLVLLSHGFGGMASNLAWLGVALASHGFIAVAVDHPGNNGLDDYTVEGYALMWLRATDLSAVLDAMLIDKTFGDKIDPLRIGAAGHSLGGYTVILLAGGMTDPGRLQAFCRSPAADTSCAPPADVSALGRKSLALLKSDPDYRQRYARFANSYRDERLRAVLAMAPGLAPAFIPESLARISIPVAIATGSADDITPPRSGAEALGKAIPHATMRTFPGAGHFAFVATCTSMGRIFVGAPCRDPVGVDRDFIHAETSRFAIDFFSANLR